MNIVIPEPEVKVTVAFESTAAPCSGCDFYRSALCVVEGRGLSSSLIASCEKYGWRQETDGKS